MFILSMLRSWGKKPRLSCSGGQTPEQNPVPYNELQGIVPEGQKLFWETLDSLASLETDEVRSELRDLTTCVKSSWSELERQMYARSLIEIARINVVLHGKS